MVCFFFFASFFSSILPITFPYLSSICCCPLLSFPQMCNPSLTRTKVNELSNTMDLESTLIRAEALFRRFHRLVEAIDKKQNFPAPRVSVAGGGGSGSSGGDEPSSSTVSPPPPSQSQSKKKDSGKATEEQSKKKIITPELRKLLSREVEFLPRKVVQKKGEGLSAGR